MLPPHGWASRRPGRGRGTLLARGAALLLLAGCGAPSAPVSEVSGLTLVPSGGGLAVAGSGGREIGFGRDRAGALTAVEKVEGRTPRAVTCVATGLDGYETEGGLVLAFSARSFVGWSSGERSAGRTC